MTGDSIAVTEPCRRPAAQPPSRRTTAVICHAPDCTATLQK